MEAGHVMPADSQVRSDASHFPIRTQELFMQMIATSRRPAVTTYPALQRLAGDDVGETLNRRFDVPSGRRLARWRPIRLDRVVVTHGPATALWMLRTQPQEFYRRTVLGFACDSLEHAASACRPTGNAADLCAASAATSRSWLRRSSRTLSQRMFQLEHVISEHLRLSGSRVAGRTQHGRATASLLEAARHTLLVGGISWTCQAPLNGLVSDEHGYAHRVHDMVLDVLQAQLGHCVAAANDDAELTWQRDRLVKRLERGPSRPA